MPQPKTDDAPSEPESRHPAPIAKQPPVAPATHTAPASPPSSRGIIPRDPGDAADIARAARVRAEVLADVAADLGRRLRGAPAEVSEGTRAASDEGAVPSRANGTDDVPGTPEAIRPSAWKSLVAAVTNECRKTNYFLSRDEERALSAEAGWSDWNDRMAGYDLVDGAEAAGRRGRDRAIEALASLPIAPNEHLADAVSRAAAAIDALPEARERYARKGTALVVATLRRIADRSA